MLKLSIETNKSLDTTMYRGVVKDADEKLIAKTSPYYNKRNAYAAGVALRIDIREGKR